MMPGIVQFQHANEQQYLHKKLPLIVTYNYRQVMNNG